MKYRITAAEYAALSDDLKTQYGQANNEGVHTLRLEGIDPAALAAKVDEFRGTNTSLMKQVEQLQAVADRFKGLDPDAARAAITELEKLKAATGGTGKADEVAEAIQRAVASAVGPLQTQIAALSADKANAERMASEARFASEFDRVALEVGARRGALTDLRRRAQEAGLTLQGERLVLVRNGAPVYKDGLEVDAKTWLTAEVLPKDDFLFEPNRGGNAPGSGGHQGGAARVLVNPDARQFGQNLEDIAKGKVEVEVAGL